MLRYLDSRVGYCQNLRRSLQTGQKLQTWYTETFGHIISKSNAPKKPATSFPGSPLFLPRESTLVSAGHVSPLSKQLPTRVDSLFFKKRREKRMQIFSNWHEDRGMEVISSIFLNDRDAEKIYSLLSQCGVSEVQIMQISHQQNILR